MVKNALGMIEVVGLAAAMEAADASVKAANVELLGYEITKGGGFIVVKVCGDVGAVKAAVDAAAVAASKINKVVAKHVIPRPHNEIGGLVLTKETVGAKVDKAEPEQLNTVEEVVVEPVSPVDEVPAEPEEIPAESTEDTLVTEAAEEAIKEEEPTRISTEVCNLCGDPACPRKKGDPRVTCIHYTTNNKEDE